MKVDFQYIVRYTPIALLFALIFVHPHPTFAATTCSLYVAPTGSDANPGTQNQPLKTIQAGIDKASSGQSVCARAGTYQEVISILNRQNLEIRGYNQEHVIIDGNHQLPDAACKQKDLACINWCYAGAKGEPPNNSCSRCQIESGSKPGRLTDGTCKPNIRTEGRSGCQYDDLVTIKDSKNIVFENFEVRNSTGRLMSVHGATSTGIIIKNVNMHHAWGSGFGIFSTPDTAVDGVRVWQTKTSYADACIVGGNGFNINNATGGTVKNSYVYNNYGEGLTTDQSDNVKYLNNILFDNFHTNLHVHGSKGTIVDGNLVFCSANAPYPFQQRNIGILLADELRSTGGSAANAGQNRTVINNIVVGCSDSISIRSQGLSKLLDDTFAYNTIIAGRPKPGDPLNSHNAFNLRVDNGVTNSYFGNNVVIQDGGSLCSGNACAASGMTSENNKMVSMTQGKNYVANPRIISVSGWPSGQSGSAQGENMIISNSKLITASHLVPNSSLSDFVVLANSPARNTGKRLAKVIKDFFANARPSSGNYDAGALQYGSAMPNQEPTPIGDPQPKWDLNDDGIVNIFDFNWLVKGMGTLFRVIDINDFKLAL